WDSVRENSDYGRACGVNDYLGVLDVGPGRCLILNDEPMQTAFLAAHDSGLFLRWQCAESEEDVLRAAENVPEPAWESTPHGIRIGGPGLLVSGSAYPGDALPEVCGEGGTVPWLHLPMPDGEYRIDTVDYQLDEQTRVILHRLRRSHTVGRTE